MQQMKSAAQRKQTPAAFKVPLSGVSAAGTALIWEEAAQTPRAQSPADQEYECSCLAEDIQTAKSGFTSPPAPSLLWWGSAAVHQVNTPMSTGWFGESREAPVLTDVFQHRDHPLFAVWPSFTSAWTGADHSHGCHTKNQIILVRTSKYKAPAVF